jgi:hypothetical protein
MRALHEMPEGPAEDLAHARWRVRFFRHLVEEHRGHPWTRDSRWYAEDAEYAAHLSQAESELSHLEAAQALIEETFSRQIEVSGD